MNKRLLVQEAPRARENARQPIGAERLCSMNSGRVSDGSAGISEHFVADGKTTTILMG